MVEITWFLFIIALFLGLGQSWIRDENLLKLQDWYTQWEAQKRRKGNEKVKKVG